MPSSCTRTAQCSSSQAAEGLTSTESFIAQWPALACQEPDGRIQGQLPGQRATANFCGGSSPGGVPSGLAEDPVPLFLGPTGVRPSSDSRAVISALDPDPG